jgi:hypothetical protein
MLQPKLLARFLILLTVFCSLLMLVPWPGLKGGYSGVFRGFGNVVFARFWFWPDGRVRFLNLHSPALIEDIYAELPPGRPAFRKPQPTAVLDTLMVLKNRTTPGQIGMLRTSARSLGYWPTAFFLALVLAKPLPWKRKGWAVLWGLVLVHLFIALRLTLTLMKSGFAADKAYALFELSPFWTRVLARVEGVIVDNPTVSFVVATFIWFIVAFTRREWGALREGALGPAEGNLKAAGPGDRQNKPS